jgi:hypothetical protein
MKSIHRSVPTLALGVSLLVSRCGGGSNSGGSGNNNPPAPAISSISPKNVSAGSSPVTLTVSGSGFLSTSAVQVGGSAEATSYVSATQLSASVPAAQLASGAQLAVVVVNGSVSSASGTPFSLEVDNPTPAIGSVSPRTVATGAASPVVTVNGTGFVSTTTINANGAARPTTFISATQVSATLTAADVAAAGTLALTAVNPSPGGGISVSVNLTVSAPTPASVITSVTPNSIVAGTQNAVITLAGTGFTPNSVVQWNGKALSTTIYYANEVAAIVLAADLTTVGTASVTVNTSTSSPSLSNAVTVSITNPPAPTLASIYPSAGPINTAAAVTLSGTGFTSLSTVAVNGETIASTFVGSTQITCSIPASALALPGNVNITVTTPAPGGGISAPMAFTTFLAIANNDIVYNATDGLLYASVLVSGVGTDGNSVEGIDPLTGAIMRQIWVGSIPNKLALSTDSTQLFVGLDGAGAVAQVNLGTGAVVNQFSLGGGPGVYNPPYTASYLAAVPGSPNSVAVAAQGSYLGGSGVTIFDSGVPRAKSSTGVGQGALSFGSSASTLYMTNGSNIERLTVDSTGVTAAVALATVSYQVASLQYDNGRLYLSNGQVFDASTGALLGTFYSSASTPATGPVVSDFTLRRAFIGSSTFNSGSQILAFNEDNFNSDGSILVNGIGEEGYPSDFQKIVRWGQNGLALSATESAYASINQIFIFQSPLVKDLSASPADLSVTLTAPASATTGTAVSWVAKVSNKGPNQAQGATLSVNLDSTLIINSVTPSQGTCSTGGEFTCDLGSLANGASATVTVSATPSSSGTLAGVATLSSTSYDPATTNNQATTSTVVSGNLYGAAPLISAISPNAVQAGSSDFTLTVTGSGFNEQSTVNLGATALTTTYASAGQLTATVPASQIANYGWQAVTVANPAPGGGTSQVSPLTIYAMINAPASGLLFDPYSRLLYATIPSTATTLTGNSVVSIDPVTGTVGTPVPVGSQPTVMTETTDGNYLFIGLSGANSLAQFDLLHQSLKATIPLSATQNGNTTSLTATWVAAMPGSDSTLAVDVNDSFGTFGIFDISGSTGSFRPNFSGYYDGVNPTFASASRVYAFDSQTSGAEFYRYSVDANGLTLIDGTTLDGLGGFSGSFRLADGLVYGAGGGIANPATTPPSQVATLPLIDFYNEGIVGYGVATAPDPSLQKDFLMMVNTAGTWAYGLARYDLNTYTPEAILGMPASASSINAGWTMLRFGQDGLALLSSGPDYTTNQTVSSVILLRGPFVTPQLLTANLAATLSSSSSNTIAHGSGNTLLTLTGSNFLPGVAVTWNGSYRTTTIVDATHVSIAIPASDLAAAGTASLVATNPGAPASTALQITIN